jgi:hypothetical protein
LLGIVQKNSRKSKEIVQCNIFVTKHFCTFLSKRKIAEIEDLTSVFYALEYYIYNIIRNVGAGAGEK